jgi:transposase
MNLFFWRRLKRVKAKIQTVDIDMSPACISAVSENLSKTMIVFYHFLLIKLFNDKLSRLRRELQQKAEAVGKKVLTPKLSISQVLGRLKGQTSMRLFNQFRYLKKKPYWGFIFEQKDIVWRRLVWMRAWYASRSDI